MPNSNQYSSNSNSNVPNHARLMKRGISVVCLCLGLWYLSSLRDGVQYWVIYHSSSPNERVFQGARSTLSTNDERGPANGRCEIVAPSGAVVASFVAIAGGSDNGWHAQVRYNGFGRAPTFTVDVPKNAPVGVGYRISTASYLWPQSSARFDVVARGSTLDSSSASLFGPQAAPTAMPVPLRLADLTIRNLNDKAYLGSELYGDDAEDQTAEQVAVSSKAAVYLIKIQNKSDREARFKVGVEADGPGWTGHYFDAPVRGRDISSEVGSWAGWQTPLLPVGGHMVLRVEISRGDPASVAATTLLRVSDLSGVALDAVRATVSMQSIARVEVTVDQGKTWETATARGVRVPESTVVGFRAIKKIATLPWPTEPFKPEWHTPETTHVGNDVWIQGSVSEDTVIVAQCGNAVETKIHVIPDNLVKPRVKNLLLITP